MDRWACVSLAALPLQLVLRGSGAQRARPIDKGGLPTVVVSEDKPQGKVLFANSAALEAGVLPGHNYALALSLCAGLRACVVSPLELAAASEEIKALLWRFSPAIEQGDEVGVFWLDASGLGRIFLSLQAWSEALRRELAKLGFAASVVVGFTRFGCYALARGSSPGTRVFDSADEERTSVARVPLACLDLEPEFRDVLAKLGVHTIRDMLQLPPSGLLSRFGRQAERLHAVAAGAFAPLEPARWRAPLAQRALFDDAESDATRLLFSIKRLLDALLEELARRGEALCQLSFALKLDRRRGSLEPEALRPAVPTLDVVQLMDLVRLRLETLSLAEGVIEVTVDAQGTPANAEQLRVFAEQPRRDPAAAQRAIARLRAEFGADSVVRAVLADGHLPEACFSWQALEELPSTAARPAGELPLPASGFAGERRLEAGGLDPAPAEGVEAMLARRPLIRRIFRRSELLAAPGRELRNDGWLIRGSEHGPVTHSAGPYLVTGGWWLREVQREYQFILTRRGELLWVYHDKRRRRWFLQGEVQ